MRVCPRCAEKVRSSARACRYCNHVFGTAIDQPPVVTVDDPVRRAAYWLLAAFLALAMATCVYGAR